LVWVAVGMATFLQLLYGVMPHMVKATVLLTAEHPWVMHPPARSLGVNSSGMAMTVERISAVTFRVSNMWASVRFYRDLLGMEVLYGGDNSGFSSLRAREKDAAILNLELGDVVTPWGRLIFHVADVDGAWKYLTDRGLTPERPRDAPWGERYFHLRDPDGHELSFARPLR
jgi:catechol 2,3-dioxygenase-like lactoylglutathione lyase family enzyme